MARKLIGMTGRVVGPNRSWGRRCGILLSLVMALVADIALVKTVLAVHDTGRFELDGNATSSASDDWDKVCHQVTGSDCSTTSNTNGAAAVTWIATNLARFDIFTGGGSKDPQDLNQWAWKSSTGTLPDKDTLLHGFATRYKLPSSPACPGPGGNTDGTTICDVLFFGSDRFDNSGDAQQGFWFFQNAVSLGTNSVGGGQGFNGVHRDGDLLIVSDFSNGGTTSTITIYKWDPTCKKTTGATAGTCGDNNLRILRTSTTASCASAGAGDAFCGLVNSNTITMPWSFTDKSSTPNKGALNGEFFEAGVNLSALGLGGECFASFLDETRSSTSTTSVLKAFVLGGFGACTSGLTTTPKDGSGVNIDANGISIGTGSVTVKDSAQLVVGGSSSWTGTLKFYLCEPGAGLCTSGGTQIGTTKNIDNTTTQPILSDAATITSVGTYCWRGEFTSTTTGVPNSTDAKVNECLTVNPVTPTVPTVASGPVQLPNGLISDDVTLTGAASEPTSPVVNSGTTGAPAAGTLTFSLYGPDDAQCSATSLVFTSAAIQVSGNGGYSSGTFKPTRTGTYRWVVSYSGDLPNTTSSTGACNDANESVIVTDTSSVTSDQNWLPNDSATITSGGGTALSGTLVFTLYTGLTCSGSVLYTQPSQSFTNSTSVTKSTSNTSVRVSATADVSWGVDVVITTPNVSSPPTRCEKSSLTIIN